MILSVFLSIALTLFATAVMSFMSMAVPIGPWVDVTLVLIATLCMRSLFPMISDYIRTRTIGLSVLSGGIAGAVATACGFSFPTLFFLNKDLFNAWMSNIPFFIGIFAAIVIAAGGFGLMIAHFYEKHMIVEEQMPFPIGQLVYKTMVAQNQMRKALELCGGAAIAFFMGIAQMTRLLPAQLSFIPRISYGLLQIPAITLKLDWAAMLLAIGFVTGHVIALPLLVGIISKIFFITPIHHTFFSLMRNEDFLLAFCSGMVLQGAFLSLFDMPRFIMQGAKRIRQGFTCQSDMLFAGSDKEKYMMLGLSAAVLMLMLSYFKFSFLAQLYVVVFTFICTYQLLILGGKLGLAPVGRYATFVMVPGLIFFGFDGVQATIVAVCVELSGMAAVDALFSYKMGQLAGIKDSLIARFQWLGLIVCALSIGIIFWILISYFGLGSSELFAQRAQARALLINAYSFNYVVMIVGFIYGFVLKYIKINPALVLGGLLMPYDFSMMLVMGGLLTYITSQPEEWHPFWSGMFAASSLWMLIKAVA